MIIRLKYIIWNQRIMTAPSGGFRLMEDRGTDTANHRDHVHLSFDRTPARAPQGLEC